MREEVRDVERLSHMLEAINVLINYKEHHTLEEAKSDPVVYFGLVKHVEIIGEAVYKLTHEFRDAHPVLNWADIEGTGTEVIAVIIPKYLSPWLLPNVSGIILANCCYIIWGDF